MLLLFCKAHSMIFVYDKALYILIGLAICFLIIEGVKWLNYTLWVMCYRPLQTVYLDHHCSNHEPLLCSLGAVFALMEQLSVCQEMVRDLLLDLPLLSSPVILLCMNKELRNQCLLLLQRSSANHYTGRKALSQSDEQHKSLTAGKTETLHL